MEQLDERAPLLPARALMMPAVEYMQLPGIFNTLCDEMKVRVFDYIPETKERARFFATEKAAYIDAMDNYPAFRADQEIKIARKILKEAAVPEAVSDWKVKLCVPSNKYAAFFCCKEPGRDVIKKSKSDAWAKGAITGIGGLGLPYTALLCVTNGPCVYISAGIGGLIALAVVNGVAAGIGAITGRLTHCACQKAICGCARPVYSEGRSVERNTAIVRDFARRVIDARLVMWRNVPQQAQAPQPPQAIEMPSYGAIN